MSDERENTAAPKWDHVEKGLKSSHVEEGQKSGASPAERPVFNNEPSPSAHIDGE